MQDLRATLAGVVSDRPTRAHTRRFVALCRRMALAYLRKKQRRRRLNPNVLRLPLDDLALDAIANLFERDDQGAFAQLRRYFTQIDWQSADDDTLFEATRRLVFSAVNDHLFFCYGEADPSLANLIRSLKRTAKAAPAFTLERRSGTLWLLLHASDEEPLPIMPPEFLEARLTAAIRQGMHTGDVMREVARILQTQTWYARRYPLTLLAQIIRAATVRVNEVTDAPETAPPTPSDALFRQDVARLIEHSVATTETAMRPSYVDKGKVDATTYARYFQAIRDRLTEEYVRRNGYALTNYKALRIYLPDLSRDAYGKQHRTIFEYLSKRTRERFVTNLREAL